MQEQIKYRTKQIALGVIKIVDVMPNKPSAWVIGKQVLRSATSIGANYRAACRAKSNEDFIHKLKIVEEEADETLYWFEVLEESELVHLSDLVAIRNEVNEILSIMVSSIKTMRNKKKIK